MKRPKIIVIDDSPEIRELFKENFKNSLEKETGIKFNIETYNQCPENINMIGDASLFFIDYFMPGKKGDQVARELIEKGSPGERVLITGNLSEALEAMSGEKAAGLIARLRKDQAAAGVQSWYEMGGHELFPKFLRKPFVSKDLINLISTLRNKQRLKVPLSLGVIGLGRLGRETVERASDSEWINHIDVFSEFFNTNPEAYKMYPKVIGGKVTPNKQLETLLESDPGVLFIATGIKSNEVIQRDKMFEATAERVYPILKTIKDRGYTGPIFIGSNPIEPLIKLAHEMGINQEQLIGESVTDTLRTRRMLVEGDYLPDKIGDIYDIDIPVMGSHSRPIPIFSKATIKGTPIDEITDYKKFRDKFTRELREIGKKIMTGANTIGSYSDAPNAVMEMLWDLHTLSSKPRSYWSMYDDKTTYRVTNVPVNMKYAGSPQFSIADSPELDSWEKKELKKQKKAFTTQRNKVKAFLKTK